MARAAQAREELTKVAARVAYIEESLELLARSMAVAK